MKYSVKLTNIAKQDIEKVIDYIEKELFAPIAAEHFFAWDICPDSRT
jgi:plasmid stabilization system protein ParE